MKKSIWTYLLVVIVPGLLLFNCKQEETTLPKVITKSVETYTADMIHCVVSGGTVVSDGGSKITESGICWSTHHLPTIQDCKTTCESSFIDVSMIYKSENVCGSDFKCNIYQWTLRNKYYVRAYAINSLGIAYGQEVSFTTWCEPVNWTLSPKTLALIYPKNETTGLSTDLTLEWLTMNGLAYDVYFGTSQNPTTKIATKLSSNRLRLSNLDVATTYYWKVKLWDTIGLCPVDSTAIWHFTTTQNMATPSVLTSTDTVFSSTGAYVGGNVTSDGGGIVIERGVYWGSSPNPEITGTKIQVGSGIGAFSITLTGLNPNTKYYQKAYGINKAGIGFGPQRSFYTGSAVDNYTISDIEGNVYPIKLIGTQVWMTSNLKTTKYANGDNIPFVVPTNEWNVLSPSAKGYCLYNNEIALKDIYGALYTWGAATNVIASNTKPSGVQGVCPDGWHLPSMPEWAILVEYLGGVEVAADKMKEPGSLHWIIPPNSGGFMPNISNNESGFTGLPGGSRNGSGGFYGMGIEGYWWSSSHDANRQYNASLFRISNFGVEYNSSEKIIGCSVRCLRD